MADKVTKDLGMRRLEYVELIVDKESNFHDGDGYRIFSKQVGVLSANG